MAKKEKLIEKAQKLLNKGNIDKALVEYKKAFETDENDLSLRLKIGDLYVKTGDKEAAINEYTEIAKVHTNKGFYLKGIAVYKQVLKLDETILEIHSKLADLYAKQRLMADAISEYSYILNHYEKKSKTSDALELLKKMVDLDPENVGVKLKLADMHQKLGFDKDAIGEFIWVCERLIGQGKLDKAEKIYLGVQKNYPSEPAVLEGLAELYKKKGDDKKFIRVATLAAASLKDSGDVENATAYCSAIFEIDPDNETARSLMEGLGGEVPESYEAEDEEGAESLISWPEATSEVSSEEAAAMAAADAAEEAAEAADAAAEAEAEAVEEAEAAEDDEPLVEVDLPDDLSDDTTDIEVEVDLSDADVSVEEGDGSDEPLIEVDLPDEVSPNEVSNDMPDDVADDTIDEVVDATAPEVEVDLDAADADVSIEDSEEGDGSDEPLIEVDLPEEVSNDMPDDAAVDTIDEVSDATSDATALDEVEEVEAADETPEIETSDANDGEVDEGDAEEGEAFDEVFETGADDTIAVAEVEMAEVDEEVEEVEDELIIPLDELEEVEEVSPEELSEAFEDEEDEGGVSLEDEFVDLSKELGIEEALDDLVTGWTDDESGEAAEEFKDSIGRQLSKEDSETHHNLGIAYMEMELYDDAIKEFKIALKDPALEFDSYNRLGLCSMGMGNPGETVEYYLKALKVKGTSDEERKGIMYELGLAYEAGEMAAEAGEMFRAVHEMEAGYREVDEKVASYEGTEASVADAIPSNDSMIEVELL